MRESRQCTCSAAVTQLIFSQEQAEKEKRVEEALKAAALAEIERKRRRQREQRKDGATSTDPGSEYFLGVA